MTEKCPAAIRMTEDSLVYYCTLPSGHKGPHTWRQRGRETIYAPKNKGVA